MKTMQRRILPAILAIALLATLAAGGWMWYDNHVDRSGWVEKDGIRFYRDFHADPVSGWLDVDGARYYFRDDGTPSTGWQEIDGITYYFGDSGPMITGWLELDENTYYFGANGAMVEGWLNMGGPCYYLRDGILVTGWQMIEGQHYYFSDEGIMQTGWLELHDGTRYLNEDGTLFTGYAVIDDRQFFFQENGIMHVGWLEQGEGLCYYAEDGALALGWTEIDGKRYYFGEDGIMQTGWLEQGEYRYYLQEDGSAAVGPTQIDGDTYYFSPKGIHVVLVNALNSVPDYYTLDLVTVTGWHQVQSICLEPLNRMLEGCSAAGIEYSINSAHRTVKEQTLILENRTKEYMKNFDLEYEQARERALLTVAIPGTSEHHLGLAVDLLGEEALGWFAEHCWEYGFILRYTAEKESITGIIDEPWHFRYVGTEVSLDMKDSGLCLEEYLGAQAVKG